MGVIKIMTEEEIKALRDAKEAADKRLAEVEAAANLAKAEADKAKADMTNLVEELKTERQKKNEALQKLNLNNDGTDVSSLIEQALQAKENERRKTELDSALSEFKSSKTEFQTDTAGLIFGKFSEELKKYNLSDISTKEQAKQRLEEIYKFVNFKTSNPDGNNYEGSPSNIPAVPITSKEVNAITEATIKSAGMTTEKFAQLKSKYPDALNGLGIN